MNEVVEFPITNHQSPVTVLFVSSGNSKSGISPIVLNQGESIKQHELVIDYFTINGKGLLGYVKNIGRLRKYLKNNKFDVVHAHYSLSGYVAALAGIHYMSPKLFKYWKQYLVFCFLITLAYNAFKINISGI